MTYEEIRDLVKFDEHNESKNYMVNEIFDDLKENIANASHIAFSYSYIYLCTWLYRYTKHFNVNTFDNAKIKEILGYDSNNRTLNFLIKKGGLLDGMEYLESTRDYPVSWILSDEMNLEFTMSSDFKEMKDYLPEVPKRFFLKRPEKGFARIIEEEGKEYEAAGTFHEVDNTHNIPFEVFLYCMSNVDIGCTGFYLYAYLKHKCDIFEDGYDVPLLTLSTDTGISETGINKYLGELKSYRMIGFIHNQEFFAIGMRSEDRKANTYTVNEKFMFSDKSLPYNRIEVMLKQDYLEMLKQKENPISKIDFDVNRLPF